MLSTYIRNDSANRPCGVLTHFRTFPHDSAINPDLYKPRVVKFPSPVADLRWMCDIVLTTDTGGEFLQRA